MGKHALRSSLCWEEWMRLCKRRHLENIQQISVSLLKMLSPPYSWITIAFRFLLTSSSVSIMLIKRTNLTRVLGRIDDAAFKLEICYVIMIKLILILWFVLERRVGGKMHASLDDKVDHQSTVLPCVKQSKLIEQLLCVRYQARNFIRLEFLLQWFSRNGNRKKILSAQVL